MPTSTARTGAAGASWTLGMLALHGWDASPTPGNTPRTDILAQHHEHQTLIAVQCKTKTRRSYFMLGKGCESPSLPGRNEWFVLVALHGTDARPDFYIIPRNVVAAYIFVSHRGWLSVPGRTGAAHKDSDIRNIDAEAVVCYRERWELLEQPVDVVPYWLPDWVFEWAEKTGLPDGHPGLVRPDDGAVAAAGVAWLPSWMPTDSAPSASE